MAVKTITVTEKAYDALKGKKAPNESFSETIMRMAGRKPLSAFFGVLGRESGERLEKAIGELRKQHSETYRERIKRIVNELNAAGK